MVIINTRFNLAHAIVCIILVAVYCTTIGCKKLVEVPAPESVLTSETVYASDASAASVMTGIYTSLANFNPLRTSTINSISVVAGASADEFDVYGGSSNANTSLVQYYQNSLNAGNPRFSGFSIWNDFYSKLYTVNLAIEKLSISNSLSTTVKTQLMGEARFLRAFLYFYLVNLYGGVPLSTTSDYRVNTTLTRASVEQVYRQILLDLIEAKSLLSESYLNSNAKSPTLERTRPNKWAATALLARTYLYIRDWANAEVQASAIINNSSIYSLSTLENVFLKNSTEAIWQLQPVNAGWNTEDARVFILPASGPTSTLPGDGYPIYISNHLVNAFEANDQRKTNWVGKVTDSSKLPSVTYHFPYKYKSAKLNSAVTEYAMVFRLAEIYLIRAEARANQDNITGSLSDLNTIRLRAALPKVDLGDKSLLLSAILKERQVELFSEWGHRWLDLKRSGTVDQVMSKVSPTKGSSWNTNWQWYPIPSYEIAQNPNIKQNFGY